MRAAASNNNNAAPPIVLAFIGFVSLGLPDGLIGVAWPSIAASFDQELEALGVLLVAFSLGYLLSSFNSGRILARVGIGELLAVSAFATASALLGFALLPAWWALLPAAALLGAGGGAIDAGLNTYAAIRFTPRMLNWLHASFGLGAALGPLIMSGVLGSGLSWQLGYGLVGAGQLGLGLAFIASRKRWVTEGGTAEPPPVHASARTTLRLPIVWLSCLVFLLYTGVEAGTGQWGFTLLTQVRALEAAPAGMLISLYWGGLTLGRILFGAFPERIEPARLLRVCLGIALAGLVCFWLAPWNLLAGTGLVLCGLALAPTFPMLIALTPRRVAPAHVANVIGFQVAAAVVGGGMLPALVGVAAISGGLSVIAAGLTGLALLLLAANSLLSSTARRSNP
jgi:fucose permease